jgi:hypothetical protein
LASGLGVVVVDLDRFEIKSTYIIGQQGSVTPVVRTFEQTTELWAVTSEEIKHAPLNYPFLADYSLWESWGPLPDSGTIRDFVFFNNYGYLVREHQNQDVLYQYNGTTQTWQPFLNLAEGERVNRMWLNEEHLTFSLNNRYLVLNSDQSILMEDNQIQWAYVDSKQTIMDLEGNVWIANADFGLFVRKTNGQEDIKSPDGPRSDNMRKVNAYNHNVWIATGNVAPWWGNTWNFGYMSGYVDHQWVNQSMGAGGNEYGPAVFDVLDVAIDPTDPRHVLFGSWEEGVIERKANGSLVYYNAQTQNCPLEEAGFDWAPGWTGVAGLCFDLEGNAWISNSYSNHPLHFMSKGGNFTSYAFENYLDNSDIIDQVLCSQTGYVFAIVRNKGILALNPNGTPTDPSDDDYVLLTDKTGSGGLPTKEVYTLKEDLDGALWVGTLRGLGIYYSPELIFSESGADAEQILITQDGNVQVLMETEAVVSIEIDGGNRKWMATQNNGLFVFSADGLEQIAHYTAENSPLPSNVLYDLAINQANGEVYVATDNGMVALVTDATNFDNEMKNIKAYPNPVLPDYDGLITIDGLGYNTDVKITDSTGALIYHTTSQGGRATWDGKLTNGNSPQSGVYSIWTSNPEGSVDNVTKIVFIR